MIVVRISIIKIRLGFSSSTCILEAKTKFYTMRILINLKIFFKAFTDHTI